MAKKKKNFITEVLGHDVSWWVDSPSVNELDEVSIEHIEKCISDGTKQGSLHITYGRHYHLQADGWWHVINWRDIACQLYRECPNDDEGQKAARKRYEEEWTF